MLELLSYNVEYGRDLDEIGLWLSQLDQQPDLICMQEYPADRVADSNPLSSLGYTCTFAPSFSKHTNTYGELTAYKTEVLTLRSSSVIDLGISSLEKYLLKNTGQRSALLTAFEYQKIHFLVINLHLLWLAVHAKRRDQLQIILDAVDINQPTIIVGDFNYSNRLAVKGLYDFMNKRKFLPAENNNHTHTFLGINHQLDYIFQSNCKVSKVRVEKANHLDHQPLFVDFEIG